MTNNDYSMYLNGIELGARMIRRNTKLLPARPDFETRAEDELTKARQALTEALEGIIKAQAEYRHKPVDA